MDEEDDASQSVIVIRQNRLIINVPRPHTNTNTNTQVQQL